MWNIFSHIWQVIPSRGIQCLTGWLPGSSSTPFLFRLSSNRINEASTYYLKYIALTASSMPNNSLVIADFKKLRLETGKWNKVEIKDTKSWSLESIKDNYVSFWVSRADLTLKAKLSHSCSLLLAFRSPLSYPVIHSLIHSFSHSAMQE